jgi:NAD(P)-dependent dehydrogenase (short-subunit alcohol dehydrogenase family)
MCLPKLVRSEYGWESQMATNHIGHFYFTNLLLPKMKAQLTKSRVVVVASMYHISAKLIISDMHFNNPDNTYTPWKAYANSKLANVLFVRALATRLEDTNVVAVALHPGIVSTNLFKHVVPEKVTPSLLCCVV